MTDEFKQLMDLSPEQKRELLARLMEKKGLSVPHIYPLTYGQYALWFLHQLAPDSGVYNESTFLRVHSVLDRSLLEQAFQKIVERHTALRTIYLLQDNKPVQKVLDHHPISFTVVDMQEKNPSYVDDYLADAMKMYIDLEHGPVFQVQVLQFAPDDYLIWLFAHHIAVDFWSASLLLADLRYLYPLLQAGHSVTFPPQKTSHQDYVRWQTDMLASAVGEEHWNYWSKQLAGPLPVLQFPTTYPRPAIQTYHGSSYHFNTSASVNKNIRALARQEGLTLYTALLAAFQILLYRYTGQDDVLVLSPTNGRTQPSFNEVVGYFVNPVVLRARFTEDLSLKHFLQQIHQTVIDALDHQDYPFPLLVSRLQPQRDPSRSPLCDVAFVMLQMDTLDDQREQPSDTLADRHAAQEHMPHHPLFELEQRDNHKAQFDLTLEIRADKETISGVFQYNTALFTENAIRDLATHLQTLLEHIGNNPDTSVSTIPMLPSEARQAYIAMTRQLPHYPQSRCIHELFEEQAALRGDKDAVIYEQQRLTYRQLNERANQLAHVLHEAGAGSQTCIGISMERSTELIVGILAILKVGAAYVPLDPAYPRDRLAFMLKDAAIDLLLTQHPFQIHLPDDHIKVVCLDQIEDALQEYPATNFVSGVRPEDLAYIIYTSGSTGSPKGVRVGHTHVGRLFASTQAYFHFNEDDVWTLFHSFAFDFSVWEIWGALLHGGKLVIVPHMTTQMPEQFYRLLATEHVTVLNQTPSAFFQLMHVEDMPARRARLSLRMIIFGGEALDFHRLQPWFERHSDSSPRLINMYGITETTVHSAYYQIKKSDVDGTQTSLIGKPLPDVAIYILDSHLQPVPTGVIGEMYIGGAGVTYGYHNRPEVMGTRFIQNPFADNSNIRMYRTGDLACQRPNGIVEYKGRGDRQIKLRGFRIELGEIEACLSRHETIQDCVVQMIEMTPGDRRLVAYVIMKNQSGPSVSELRAFLRQSLPDYMVPATYIQLESFPLTPQGKLDQRALLVLQPQRTREETPYSVPQNKTEQIIADIWRSVLGLEQVGIHDNFLDIGGNSLLITEVHLRMRKALQQDIDLISLFRYPTIASIAEYVAKEKMQTTSQALLDGNARASRRQDLLKRRQQNGRR